MRQKSVKEWIKKHISVIIVLFVILLIGYYSYLTDFYKLSYLEGTYYLEDSSGWMVLIFDKEDLSLYRAIEAEAIPYTEKQEYKISNRNYQKDFLGFFWGSDGLAPIAFRGADNAGFFSANCVAAYYIDAFANEYNLNEEEISELEEQNDVSYSIVSRYYIKDDNLCILQLGDIVLQKCEKLPEEIQNEIEYLDFLDKN